MAFLCYIGLLVKNVPYSLFLGRKELGMKKTSLVQISVDSYALSLMYGVCGGLVSGVPAIAVSLSESYKLSTAIHGLFALISILSFLALVWAARLTIRHIKNTPELITSYILAKGGYPTETVRKEILFPSTFMNAALAMFSYASTSSGMYVLFGRIGPLFASVLGLSLLGFLYIVVVTTLMFRKLDRLAAVHGWRHFLYWESKEFGRLYDTM